jgi:protein-serine/threonine kinase
MDPVQPVQLHEIYRPPTKSTLSASTSKAQKVMQWFRGGKHRIPSDDSGPEVIIPVENNLSGQSQGSSNFHNTRALESSSTVNRTDAPSVVITPASHSQEKGKRSNVLSWLPGRSVSSGTSHAGRGDTQKAAAYDPALIRIHHGAVDVGTVASGSPPDLFRHVTQVLMTMGVEIQKEEEYKYRCIRPKKRRDGQNVGLGLKEAAGSSLSAFNVAGSATLNGVRYYIVLL